MCIVCTHERPTQVNIANVMHQQGFSTKHFEAVLDKYGEALPVLEATLGHDHPDVTCVKEKYAPFFSFTSV